MKRAFLRLALALAAGAALPACFVEPRPVEEIFDVPFLSGDYCNYENPESCHDGDPCTRDRCTDWSQCVYEKDDSLVPDDGQECTVDICTDGVRTHEPAEAGAPCGAGGALQCDGKGACVGCGGDPARCGQATSCLAWSCEADTCAPEPTPAGQALPSLDQVPGDCGLLRCDGKGGVESVRAQDPPTTSNDVCLEVDCFTGTIGPRPAGALCGGICLPSDDSSGMAQPKVCNGAGACVEGEPTRCGLGYGCTDGACQTECTPTSAPVACDFGVPCVDGKCRIPSGPLADCQAACDTFAALGCQEDLSGETCELRCQRLVEDSPGACSSQAEAYVACLGKSAPAATTCAEHRTVCGAEYELYLECTGKDIPDGPGCSPLPCSTSFDGCSCAAFCGESLFADDCVADEDGAFTCTCARDGATVATCQSAPGCGIEKGCCKDVL
jgi:hypothetical protein